jgi:hypothetical protein
LGCRGAASERKNSCPSAHDAHGSSPVEHPHKTDLLGPTQQQAKLVSKQQHRDRRTEGTSHLLKTLLDADKDLLEAETRLERARLHKAGIEQVVLEKARSEKERLVSWTQVLPIEVKIR